MTLPEAMVWNQVRDNKLGFKVRRQHPIGPYVVDFYAAASRLIIEVDGEAHNRGERPERDHRRGEYLTGLGYRLMRVSAVDVLRDMDSVIQGIVAEATRPLHHPSDGPPPRAGEEL